MTDSIPTEKKPLDICVNITHYRFKEKRQRRLDTVWKNRNFPRCGNEKGPASPKLAGLRDAEPHHKEEKPLCWK
jgi:hypothetical protein